MNTLKEILDAIKNGDISYGIDKDYYFVLDTGDRELVFLKRNDKISPHQKDLDYHNEVRHQWPENCYDGEVIWSCCEHDEVLEIFLEALELKYLG